MTARAGEHSAGKDGKDSRWVAAGRVGRPHGLDGSFYVTGASPRLLALGTVITVSSCAAKIVRRAGTDEHPIVRLEGIEDRGAAEAVRGIELKVDLDKAPALEEGEWWASELEGCEVVDGEQLVGIVTRLVELPSCEALEVHLVASDTAGIAHKEGELLIPMVRAAIRKVDLAQRRIDVDTGFLGELL